MMRVAVLTALVVVIASSCNSEDPTATTLTTTGFHVDTIARTTSAPVDATTPETAPEDTQPAGTEQSETATTSALRERNEDGGLFGLLVEPEYEGGYDRDVWSVRWSDAVNDHLGWRQPDCKWAFYAAEETPECDVSRTDPHRDHLVPLAEAHRSGGHMWDDDLRRKFYLDTDNLYVLGSAENIAKSDSDPDTWMPQRGECRYINEWVAVKTKYGLSADTDEIESIMWWLTECGAINYADDPQTGALTDCGLAFLSDLTGAARAMEEVGPDSTINGLQAALAIADSSLTECSTPEEFVNTAQTLLAEEDDIGNLEYLANGWLGYSCKLKGEGKPICQDVTSKQKCVAAFWDATIAIDITLGIIGSSFDEAVEAGAMSEGEAAIIFADGLDECGDPEEWDATVAAAMEDAPPIADNLTPTYETLCSTVNPAPELCA